MDAFRDPATDTIVVMSSAQVGKTEILNNVVGYHIDQDPCPILVLQPTLEMAEAWSKDRLAPMLRDSPCLRAKVQDPQSRNSGNTIRHKVFAGGQITMSGANSPASLAMRPIRLVLQDEVDRYPLSAGSEGDPSDLAWKRATTFWNRKRLMTSTPTVKGASRIESAYLKSTMERYHVPCHQCGEAQALKWAQVRWDNSDPETARYECEVCGAHWTDAQRWQALQHGAWVAEKPDAAARGFHLNEIYSPWSHIADMVRAFLSAKGLPETLKTFVNTVLGETWEESGETVEPDILHSTRREPYSDALPDGALVTVAGVDQQKGWLAIEVVAFGEDQESWSIEYREIIGDTSDHKRGAWADLKDMLIHARYPHDSGVEHRIEAVAIDTHGPYTSAAYKFCKSMKAPRTYGIRGRGGMGLPVVAAHSRNNDERISLFTLGVDTLKSRLYSRLYDVTDPGPGYCHFPVEYGEEYFEGLASEKLITKYRQGRAVQSWVPKSGTRQEPLDCRVYAMAALEIMSPSWTAFRRRVQVEQQPESLPTPTPQTNPAARRVKPSRGFSVKNWR